MGHLDYSSLLSTLESIGFEGYLVSEAMPYGEPDECAKAGFDYLKETLSVLK
jgi:sugar phosphate isomerase/epimerase